MKKEIIYAYTAGIFDGEGYVGIDKIGNTKNSKTPHYGLRVVISQKDGLIMNFLKENFGGNVYKQRNGSEYFIYRWRIHSKMAEEFLKSIYPYLTIKKEQAKLALSFANSKRINSNTNRTDKKTGKFIKTSDEEFKWRMDIKEELSKLKKVYTPYSS